jgi:hypothetical protein
MKKIHHVFLGLLTIASLSAEQKTPSTFTPYAGVKLGYTHLNMGSNNTFEAIPQSAGKDSRSLNKKSKKHLGFFGVTGGVDYWHGNTYLLGVEGFYEYNVASSLSRNDQFRHPVGTNASYNVYSKTVLDHTLGLAPSIGIKTGSLFGNLFSDGFSAGALYAKAGLVLSHGSIKTSFHAQRLVDKTNNEKNQSFWVPGLRLGLGYRIVKKDGPSLCLDFTYDIYNKKSTSISGNANGIGSVKYDYLIKPRVFKVGLGLAYAF